MGFGVRGLGFAVCGLGVWGCGLEVALGAQDNGEGGGCRNLQPKKRMDVPACCCCCCCCCCCWRAWRCCKNPIKGDTPVVYIDD